MYANFDSPFVSSITKVTNDSDNGNDKAKAAHKKVRPDYPFPR